jgi:hypothetical protein
MGLLHITALFAWYICPDGSLSFLCRVVRYEHSIRVRPVASYGRRNPVSSQVEAALLMGPRKQLFTHTGTPLTHHMSSIHLS